MDPDSVQASASCTIRLLYSAVKQRGPKAAEPNPLAKKLAETERELARYKARLERAEAMIELQKKVSQLLGIALPELPPDDGSSGRRS